MCNLKKIYKVKLIEIERRKVVTRNGRWEKKGEVGKKNKLLLIQLRIRSEDLTYNMVPILHNTTLYN